jgi:hypothetical protein
LIQLLYFFQLLVHQKPKACEVLCHDRSLGFIDQQLQQKEGAEIDEIDPRRGM